MTSTDTLASPVGFTFMERPPGAIGVGAEAGDLWPVPITGRFSHQRVGSHNVGRVPSLRPFLQGRQFLLDRNQAIFDKLGHVVIIVSIRRRPPVVLFDFVADLGPWN